MNLKFKIKGLDCANCANELERAIEKIEEIDMVNINFIMERLVIECKGTDKEYIIKKIKKVIKKEDSEVSIEEI